MNSILLIEDRPFWANLIKVELEKHCAVKVEWVENGKLGVEKIKAEGSSFHGIITDVEMPVLDGISATKAIRKLGYAKPIVGFSSITPISDFMKSGLEAGMNVCIAKNLDKGIFLQIAKALELTARK